MENNSSNIPITPSYMDVGWFNGPLRQFSVSIGPSPREREILYGTLSTVYYSVHC